MIYLDYAASAPPYPQCADELRRVMCEFYGNPGGIHEEANRARRLLNQSRRSLARRLGVDDREIFFTSGGTESNNWAVKTALAASGKRHMVVAASEHKSVLESARAMQRQGVEVSFVRPDGNGLVTEAAVAAALRHDTGLLCVQAVNNETGVIQDVEAMAALAHSRGALYLCDAVQSFGHLRQELRGADLISVSAHKLGGPRGVGFLAARHSRLSLRPFIHGGGQELQYRSGTENLPAIAAFATAAELAFGELDAEQERLSRLSDRFSEALRAVCPGMKLNGESAPRHPGILSCRFPGISAEELALRLDIEGICASPGAACSARINVPSHVLRSMGLSDEEAAASLRFSLGRLTTEEELERAAAAVGKILERKK